MKSTLTRTVEKIANFFCDRTKELILALLFLGACGSSWALLPLVGVTAYSNLPPSLWPYMPHLERATPESLCTNAIAIAALGTSSGGNPFFLQLCRARPNNLSVRS